ncbi:MAG: CubicO group peptidase (beta-lactamase class C family) [Flavobacteriales bacterium]|jgi:CubicO group peptidase (beta-lactamase class C family)
MKRVIVLLFGCLVTLSNLSHADNEIIPTLAELRGKIESIRTETNTPGAAVVIIEDGRISLLEGFGYANIEKQTPVNENTMFRIGSVSKMFVALSALRLKQEGALDLNAKLSDLLPELKFDNPWEDQFPIRFIHLLEHTTGWHDMHIPEYAAAGSDYKGLREALASHTDSRTSRWAPGTRTAYSNIGPAVAAHIIEIITEMPYETYVQKHFFDALGMDNATFFESEHYKQNAASLYFNDEVEPYWDILYRPSGSINASIADMAKFLTFLLGNGAAPTKSLLAAESIREMELTHSTLGAEAGLNAGYGISNYTSGFGSYQVAFHGHNGGMWGAMAELTYSPELNSGYVSVINTSGPGQSQIADAIKSYLLRDRVEPEVQTVALPEHYKALTGWYRAINPRNELGRHITDVATAMHFSAEGERFIRQPLVGGWKSSDYVNSDGLLVDVWTGLASIAIVNDPLAGETVAVGDALYKRISPLFVFSPIALIVALLLFSLVYFGFLLVHGIAVLCKKEQLKLLQKIWSGPALASVYLVFFAVTASILSLDLSNLAGINMATLYLFVSSLIYPITVFAAAWLVWKARRNIHGVLARIFAFTYLFLHVGTVLYLYNYGQIGVKVWS